MTRQLGARHAVLLLLLLLLSGTTRNASCSNSYNPYLYDLTAPLFTPDGRLLQTEYATRAADHSSPLISARINDNLAVMACCHGRRRRGAAVSTTTSTNGPLALPLPPVQERLILLPSLSASISCLSVATNHDQNEIQPSSSRPTQPTIVLALAGVRADCLHLLQVVQDRVWEIHRKYGSVSHAWDTQEAATTTTLLNARAIATVIASECQRFTFGGGIRNLGGTTWVTASDNWLLHGASSKDDDDDDAVAVDKALFVLHQTDPSGALHDVVLGRQTAVLGGGDAGVRLQRRLDREWSGAWIDNDDKNLVEDDTGAHEHERRCLGHLLSILVEERAQDMHVSDARNVDAKNNAESWSSLLEVVLLSPSKGAIKLTSNQVQSLLLAHSTSLQRE
jgi:Proteasome subunit A N-terminal signature